MLRPMANLFAVSDLEPALLDEMEDRLRRAGEFSEVWRPAPGWVAAQAPLPESEPDGDIARSHGLAFIEGRDRLERGDDHRWPHRVADVVDRAPTRLSEFPGDFAFVRFRPDGTALAVRSCAGLAPLYLYRRAGGGLALGTLLNYFPRLLPEAFRADPLINASSTASSRFLYGRTFVEGVSILPPASFMELFPGRTPKTGIYWDPRPQEGDEPRPDPEHAHQLRRILIETLERDLDPAGRNLLALSGGVDSSALGALAAGTMGRRLSSWSLISAYEPERSHELSYIEPLTQSFGIEPARKLELTVDHSMRWVFETPALPYQVISPILCELPDICSEQEVRVLVGAEFADEVCGHWVRITDWARSTSLPQLLGNPKALPFGPRDYVRWTRRRFLDAIRQPLVPIPRRPRRWARPEVEAEYRDWFKAHRAARARDRRPLKELADLLAVDISVVMHWEGTTPLGVRRSLPFFNREMLDLAFTCSPRELLGPGSKRLLRDALPDDVPARYLDRSDKGAWGARFGDELARHAATLAPPDEEALDAAAALVRADWLPTPPADAAHEDVYNMRLAMRIAAYLKSRG
jgi:hypothetical protein